MTDDEKTINDLFQDAYSREIRALLDERDQGRIREDHYRIGAEITERRVAALEESLQRVVTTVEMLFAGAERDPAIRQARALLNESESEPVSEASDE